MKYLPVGLSIEGRLIVLIGGGRVALQKLHTLLRFNCRIRVFALCVQDEIKKMNIDWLEAPYNPSMLTGAFLVYVCTSDAELNSRVAVDARSAGALVNVADCPANCDFVSPAVWYHDSMSVSVLSDGKNAKQSVEWRNAIKKWGEDDRSLLKG